MYFHSERGYNVINYNASENQAYPKQPGMIQFPTTDQSMLCNYKLYLITKMWYRDSHLGDTYETKKF